MFNPYLPQETLDYIVDLLHDERETLKECCLVSKSWIPRARKHLFAGIKFGSVGNLESWKKTFPDPPSSPAYHTLTLTIGCTQAVTTEDAEPGGWIPTFSRVVRLELSVSRIDPINPSGMEAILAPYHEFPPALKSLRIESKFLSYPPIFNLVRSFLFLEDLALVGCHPWWEGNDGNLHQQQNVDPSASGPAFTGSLELLLGGLRNVARRLLDLPNGLNFRKLVLLWIDVEDLWWIMKLVEECASMLCITNPVRYFWSRAGAITYLYLQVTPTQLPLISRKRQNSEMWFFGLNRHPLHGSSRHSRPLHPNLEISSRF